MPRHKRYVPHGVIPAVLLPFHDDLSIDEAAFLCDFAPAASFVVTNMSSLATPHVLIPSPTPSSLRYACAVSMWR